MRIVADARNDFFDAAVFVANDLRLYRFQIHCAAPFARAVQRLEHTVQMQQLIHARSVFAGLWPLGVGKDGCHLGVSKARMAVHYGRVELVGVDVAIGSDEHVAHHA